MATPFTVAKSFKRGGIRQGNVYVISGEAGTYVASTVGRIKDANVSLEPIASAQDTQGRTSVIGYTLSAQFVMMQNEDEEIAAAGVMAYPADASEFESGYDVLFTDGPLTASQVETALNDVGGRIIPGILLEGVLPKPSVSIDYGTSESEISVSMDGVLQPEALVGFDTDPVLTFA